MEIKNFWKDKTKWISASKNTSICLVGCSIGDFGTIIYFQYFYPQITLWIVMSLAILNGLITSVILETLILHFKENFNLKKSLKVAISMSFISMIFMELVMNIVDFSITKGTTSFDNPIYWIGIIISMIFGFLAPLPYNYYKLKKFNKSCCSKDLN